MNMRNWRKSWTRVGVLLGLTLSAGLIGGATTARAEMPLGRTLFGGALLGVTSASENVGTGFGFGLNAGYFFLDPFGANLVVKSANHEQGITSLLFGLEGLYRVDAWVPGLTGGLTIGTMKFSGGGLAGDYHFTAGGKVSYDYFLPTYPISIGAEAALSWTKPGDSMLTVFNGMATTKIWL